MGRQRAVAAREEERRRLHRDLHDGLGPAMAAIRLRLDAAAARLAHDPAARHLIAEAATEAGRLIDEFRRIIDDLRPPDFADDGLSGALLRLVARLGGNRPAIIADLPDQSTKLPEATELAAYRIAAEGLTNVLRHAAAQQVTVRLAIDDRNIVLDVCDDGTGPVHGGRHGYGTGMWSMRQRAEDVGGCCVVRPRPDAPSGTLVRAVLPWSKA